MSRHSLSFILNKEEEEDAKMQDSVFGDFTSQPGSSNCLSFAPKAQPQPQQPTRQPPSLSAFLPFVALVHSTSAFEVVNPKKRKAASLSASSVASLVSNKQRRLETTTAPSTTSALKEEVLEHLRTIQERAVRAQRQQHSQHNASSPQREEDAVTCRRNKMLAQQLLRETTFQSNANPDESNGLGKVKRATPEQVSFLERLFVLDPLPSTVTRRMIAEKLGMTPKKVQIWFQNKRARVKTDVPPALNNNSTSTSTTTNTTEDNNNTKQQKKRTRRIAPRTPDMLVFHNLGICADGQLVLCSEGVPPLILNPALSRDNSL